MSLPLSVFFFLKYLGVFFSCEICTALQHTIDHSMLLANRSIAGSCLTETTKCFTLRLKVKISHFSLV